MRPLLFLAGTPPGTFSTTWLCQSSCVFFPSCRLGFSRSRPAFLYRLGAPRSRRRTSSPVCEDLWAPATETRPPTRHLIPENPYAPSKPLLRELTAVSELLNPPAHSPTGSGRSFPSHQILLDSAIVLGLVLSGLVQRGLVQEKLVPPGLVQFGLVQECD